MTQIVAGLPPPNSLSDTTGSNLYCIPRAIASGDTAASLIANGHALPLLGNDLAFAAVELIIRENGTAKRVAASVTAFDPWRHVLPSHAKERLATLLDAMSRARQPFAGFTSGKQAIMGVINVTPDSFSDGGDHATTEKAVQHAITLAEAGADILDVGGESTRPGAQRVDADTEQQRVVPVIAALAQRGLLVSIDTRNASTMSAAVSAGAKIINDVTALSSDPNAVKVAVEHEADVILMHMQGEPQNMQQSPNYDDTVADVFDYLSNRVESCLKSGIKIESICVDPGIGFGKTDRHNIEIINSLAAFHGIGCALMFGASRKSFIGRLADEKDPKARGAGSIAAALAAAAQGVGILRVHDVADTRQALQIWQYQAGNAEIT